MRLDQYLVQNGFYDSRSKAQNAIKNGDILVNGLKPKSSCDVSEKDEIEVVSNSCPYVSRGGLKLLCAIEEFKLDFNDKVVLDIGASTGGFTDCALKHNAKLVYSIDVGSSQLHPTLKTNPKVISYENTNILDFKCDTHFDFIVMDVSFVSIEYLLQGICNFISDDTIFIALIKPQFELDGKRFKNGIVKDYHLWLDAICNVSDALNLKGLSIYKLVKSKIKGGDGNQEFLALIKKGNYKELNFLSIVKE